MARINIDDKWWTDPRRLALGASIGNQDTADGQMLRLVKLAQIYWTDKFSPRIPIPSSLYNASGFHGAFIEVGLVEETKEGFYLKGSCEFFEWILKKRGDPTKAGIASAESRKKKFGSAIPINATNSKKPNGTEPNPNEKPNRNRTEPNASSSSSSSISISISNKELNTNTINQTRKVSKMPNAPEPDGSGPVISAYCSAFKKRYNTNPTITPKDISQVKQIIKAVGYEKALVMVQVYVQMENPWFKKKTHDLQTLLGNIQAVAVASKTGIDPDKKKDPFDFFDKLEGKEVCL